MIKWMIPIKQQIVRKAYIEKRLREQYGKDPMFEERVAQLFSMASPHMLFENPQHCPVCKLEINAVDLFRERVFGFSDIPKTAEFTTEDEAAAIEEIRHLQEAGLNEELDRIMKAYTNGGFIPFECPNGHYLEATIFGGVVRPRSKSIYDDYLAILKRYVPYLTHVV